MLRDTAGERIGTWFCCCRCILIPPSSGHLPYILLRKTQRRRVRCIPLSLLLRFYIRHLVRLLGTAGEEFDTWFCCCLCLLTPSPFGHSPYIPCRNTGGEDWYLILLLSLYFNPSVLRPPPLYFALQNTPSCCGSRQGERIENGISLF